MVEARILHRDAMSLIADADFEQAQGNADKARELLQTSLDLETRAANFYLQRTDVEPTRSQLFKGAAIIALRLQEMRKAEVFIAIALSGNPPSHTLEDLRNILEDVHFGRHILSNNVQLSTNEIDLTLTGNAIGYGVADKDEIFRRIDALQIIFIRNAERKRQIQFRKAGRPSSEVTRGVQMFLATPRAASFGLTIRLGSEQPSLPGIARTEGLVEETIQALKALQSDQESKLDQLIPEPAYRQNFIATARELLPDGQKVKAVHLSTDVDERRDSVSLTKQRREIAPSGEKPPSTPSYSDDPIAIRGEIRAMDSREENEFVTLLFADGSEKLFVPGEQMDALTLYYKTPVEVTARRSGKRLIFVDIKRTETDE